MLVLAASSTCFSQLTTFLLQTVACFRPCPGTYQMWGLWCVTAVKGSALEDGETQRTEKHWAPDREHCVSSCTRGRQQLMDTKDLFVRKSPQIRVVPCQRGLLTDMPATLACGRSPVLYENIFTLSWDYFFSIIKMQMTSSTYQTEPATRKSTWSA